jgi:hypothetical protein
VLRKILLAMFALAASLSFSAVAVAADEIQGITASPYSQDIKLSPGGKYSGTVNISNPGNTDYNFTASAAPFSVQGEDYAPQFTARPDLVDASKWFSFPQTRFHLVPGQQVPVQFTIQPPSDISGGGYYAAVFAQADALPGPGIRGQKRVGMIVYMTVGGDIHREGHVASFSVPFLHTVPPLHSQLRIQNIGNVHFDSDITVQIKDLFGNVKGQIEQQHVIMPKTIRRVDLDWAKAPSFGLFRVGGNIQYLGRTEALPTHWTLMLSANAFLAVFGVLVAMGLFAFITRRGRRNVRRG